jgi:4'-phosphopantetheinyl transferase
MPLTHLESTSSSHVWGWWHVTESETALQGMLAVSESVPDTMTHPQKRLEFLAGRVLTQQLMQSTGLTYRGLTKDTHGKPFLKDSQWQISLSHSFPYVAVLLREHDSAGIDIEQPKEKLLRIAPRILHPEELADAGADITKHCILWCAKESLIKIYGRKDLVLAKNLQISPFSLEKEGSIIGRIIVDSSITTVNLRYRVTPDFVVVFNT